MHIPGAASRGRAWAGWALVLLAVATAAVVLPAGAQDGAAPPAVVDRGEELYQVHCVACHGGAGQGGEVPGGLGAAPPLADAGVGAAYVDLTLRTGRMPPPGDPFDNRPREVILDAEERAALVAYMVEEFGIAPNIPEVAEGDAALGLSVYAANCAHCHGSTGAGGVAGAGAYTPALERPDPVTIVEAIRVGPFEMPAFSTDQISVQEAASVAAFLEVVEEEQGTPLLGLLELNPVYAGGFVALLSAALLLSLFFIAGRPSWFPDAKRAASATPAQPDPEPDEPYAAPQLPPGGEPAPGTDAEVEEAEVEEAEEERVRREEEQER